MINRTDFILSILPGLKSTFSKNLFLVQIWINILFFMKHFRKIHVDFIENVKETEYNIRNQLSVIYRAL